MRDEVDSSTTAQARNTGPDLGHNNTNLKTVAILPVSRNVPIDAFSRKLQAALEEIGASTSFLNQASISSHLGRHAFTRMGKLKVSTPPRLFSCRLLQGCDSQPGGWPTKNRNIVLYSMSQILL